MDRPLTADDHISDAPFTHHGRVSAYDHSDLPAASAAPHAAAPHAPASQPAARKHSSASYSEASEASESSSAGSCCSYLHFLLFMRAVAAISLLTIAIVSCEAIRQTIVHKPVSSPPDFFTAVLALVFHLLTALLLIAAVARWRFVLLRIQLLSSFFFLGGAMCYLAVLVLSNVTVEGRFDLWLVDVMRVVCAALFVVGVGFVVLGCVGGKKMERRRRLEEADERRKRDLDEM